MRRHLFPAALGLGLILLQASLAWFIAASAPAGNRWLGDTISFPSDTAVYLSYLRQGAAGHVALDNLFAVEPHALRLDPVWSGLGLLARSGIDPLWLYESARWGATLFLVFALMAVARDMTKNERDARWATVLMFLGCGLGWAYSIWLYKFGVWQTGTIAAADAGTEFALAPLLLAGPHLILSAALLITGLHRSWKALKEEKMHDLVIAILACAALFSFHPYFIPLVSIFWILALWRNRKPRLWRRAAWLTLAYLPAGLIYAPLAFDPTFRTHHLVVNRLPLPAALSWVFTLAPFVLAAVWRYRTKNRLSQKEEWLIAWIISALACIATPLLWKRKFIEDLNLALIFLSLPFWLAVRDAWLRHKAGIHRVLGVAILVAALGLDFIHVMTSQVGWLATPEKRQWFYRPDEMFAAWEVLARAPTSSIAVTDDLWTGIWTPAYSGLRVWVSHDHETPDFQGKVATWKEKMATQDLTEVRKWLDESKITHIILTKPETEARFARLQDDGSWRTGFASGTVLVLERTTE